MGVLDTLVNVAILGGIGYFVFFYKGTDFVGGVKNTIDGIMGDLGLMTSEADKQKMVADITSAESRVFESICDVSTTEEFRQLMISKGIPAYADAFRTASQDLLLRGMADEKARAGCS
jgi:hypothetical protein